jgi:hypothetical protein
MGNELFIGSYPNSYIFDGTRLQMIPGFWGYQVRDIISFRGKYIACVNSSPFVSYRLPELPVKIKPSYLVIWDKNSFPELMKDRYILSRAAQIKTAEIGQNIMASSLAAYHGRIFIGTHNEGGVYVTAAKSSGILISNAVKVDSLRKAQLTWKAIIPAETSVKFQIRSAKTKKGLESKAFLGIEATSESFYSVSGQTLSPAHHEDEWIQYKVYLSTSNPAKTPYLLDVSLSKAQSN